MNFKICKAFANGSSANIKFSKTQLSKILQLEGLIFDIIDPTKMLPKTINKVDELSKKVALNDIIGIANTSKKNFKMCPKCLSSRNNSNILLNERYYEN